MKNDIEPTGDRLAGAPLYRFRFVGDDVEHVGVMADEVSELHPDAVHRASASTTPSTTACSSSATKEDDMAVPTIPSPPANLISPYGSASPATPQWTSFLPSGPGGVATGLTPQMLAGINPPMTPPPPPAAAAGGGFSPYQQMLDLLPADAGRVRWWWRQQLPPRPHGADEIPAPMAGAGPADMAAYQQAQNSVQAKRGNLALQMIGAGGGRRRGRGGGGSDRDRG